MSVSQFNLLYLLINLRFRYTISSKLNICDLEIIKNIISKNSLNHNKFFLLTIDLINNILTAYDPAVLAYATRVEIVFYLFL